MLAIVSLSVLLHALIAWRLMPALAGFAGVQAGLGAMLVLTALAMPLGLAGRRLHMPRLATVLTWAGLLSLGLFSSLLVLTLLREAVLLVSLLAAWVDPAAVALDAVAR